MTQVMKGIRILEVAQFTFVPRRERFWPTGARTLSKWSTPSGATPSAAS